MGDVQVKRKIISVSPQARIANYPSRTSSPTKSTRSPSPSKRTYMQAVAPPSEAIRPRAKVSSGAVNGTSGKKPASTLSPGYRSGSSTPRAPSPVKQQPRFPDGIGARTLSRVRSKAALSAVSAPSSPRVASARVGYASLSAATSDNVLSKAGAPRLRRPSISSISQLSSPPSAPSVVYSPPLSAVSFSQDSDSQSNVSTQRIKAKVTSLAKGKPPVSGQSSPTPLLLPSPALSRSPSQTPLSPAASQFRRLGRTVSIGALSAPSTPAPQVYPITTASPAANSHRYATLRSPSYTHRPPQSFTSPLQNDHKPLKSDPALVPLPPLSPPASNVSFSSRSSVSRQFATDRAAAPGIVVNGTNHARRSSATYSMDALNVRSRSRSNSLVIHDISPPVQRRTDSSEPDIDETNEERTLKAEAKSYRKIADLEITTKSLLAINSQLEANKHKQAKEIRDLRRKLRESQLSLPPRTYRELKASGDAVDDEEPEEQQEIDGDEDAKLTAEAIRLGKDDEAFDRVRLILENLLTTGKQALAVKVEDLAPPKGTAKVLHEVEARTWRGDSGLTAPGIGDVAEDIPLDDESSSSSDYGDEVLSRTLSSSSQDFNNSTARSEKEVEELVGSLNPSLSARLT